MSPAWTHGYANGAKIIVMAHALGDVDLGDEREVIQRLSVNGFTSAEINPYLDSVIDHARAHRQVFPEMMP